MILPSLINLFKRNNKKPNTLEDNTDLIKNKIDKKLSKEKLEEIHFLLVSKISRLISFRDELENGVLTDDVLEICSEVNAWYLENKEDLNERSRKVFEKNVMPYDPNGITFLDISTKMTNLLAEIDKILKNY